jgi:hypothetical protein
VSLADKCKTAWLAFIVLMMVASMILSAYSYGHTVGFQNGWIFGESLEKIRNNAKEKK